MTTIPMTNLPNPSALRKALRGQGYTPLPAKGKAVLLKRWSSIRIDDPEIDRWAADLGWMQNTGIRCDRLAAVDIDVVDEGMSIEVQRLAERHFGASVLQRVGRAPKILLLYRAARGSTSKKVRAPRYGTPEDVQRTFDGENNRPLHGVEVLRGKGAQFAAFGVHPNGVAYSWVNGRSPLDVRARDLTPIGDSVVRDFLDGVRAYFRGRGLVPERRKRSPNTGSDSDDFPRVYDLTSDTVVEVVTDEFAGAWSVADLENALRKLPDNDFTVRCTLSCFRESADGDNGSAGICEDGYLRVTDYVLDEVHLRPSVDRREELTDSQRAQIVGEGAQFFQELLTGWAFVGTENKSFRLDHPLDDGYTKIALKDLTRRVNFEEENVVDKWLRTRESHIADVRMFSPRHPDDRVFTDGGRRVLNTFVPPKWDLEPDPTGLAIWEEFMAHLLPLERERELFLDWLANKIQRPWERMFGVMMVADGVFGTGRGTLHGIMARLLGPSYVIGVGFDIFSGTSNQAQYYDWLYQSIMVCVGEALEAESVDWKGRRGAFERIKSIIEPGNGAPVYLPRKKKSTAISDIFASIFLATNHADSIALAEGDRRLLVLSNGQAMPEPLRRLVYGKKGGLGLMGDPSQLTAVRDALYSRVVRTDLLAAPEMTEAKRRMVAGGVTDLDEAFTSFIEKTQALCFASSQFKQFCVVLSATEENDLPDEESLDRILRGRFLRSKGCKTDRGWSRVVMGNGKKARIVLAPGCPMPDSPRDEIERVAGVLSALRTEATTG